MDINSVSNANPFSQGNKSKVGNPSVVPGISADQIRNIRQSFEKESQHLQKTLGDTAHQTMLVAMYEGTENLLNKRISEFEVTQYLESLKLNAQELHNRGVSPQEFREEIQRQSQDSVFNIIKNG